MKSWVYAAGCVLQVSPLIEVARRHVSVATRPGTAAGATYVYCMATPSRADVNPRWADAVYADDLYYVFGLPLTADSSATQRALSLLVMRYWVNFIRSGSVAVTVIQSINQSINLFRYTQKAYRLQNHNSKSIHIMCNR